MRPMENSRRTERLKESSAKRTAMHFSPLFQHPARTPTRLSSTESRTGNQRTGEQPVWPAAENQETQGHGCGPMAPRSLALPSPIRRHQTGSCFVPSAAQEGGLPGLGLRYPSHSEFEDQPRANGFWRWSRCPTPGTSASGGRRKGGLTRTHTCTSMYTLSRATACPADRTERQAGN